jgi:hypothetical protein
MTNLFILSKLFLSPMTISGTATGIPGQWSYNADNELLGYGLKTFTYDPNGNMSGKVDAGQGTSYTNDVGDRLMRVESGSSSVIAEYYCDPFGRRLWKDIDGVRTYFIYSDEGLVGEYDVYGAELRTYGWALRPPPAWRQNRSAILAKRHQLWQNVLKRQSVVSVGPEKSDETRSRA